jgi:hypothetical protein
MLKQISNYRLFLRKTTKTKQLKLINKLILICFLTSLTNKAFLLSKLFFSETKNNLWFNLNIKANIKFINNKFCLFFFNSILELLHFISLTKSLTLIPYTFFPLKILNGNSKLELPFNIFNLISKNILSNCFIIFLFWKNLILSVYSVLFNLFLTKKILCQH